MKAEIRQVEVADLETRDGKEGLREVTGHPAPFNKEAVIGGWFREVIRPGAFTRAIAEKQDTLSTVNHDFKTVMARVSAGNLQLEEDKKGLFMRMQPADTTVSRDLIANIDAGNITKMSFMFDVVRETWHAGKKRAGKKDLDLRELHELDLLDVSAVTFPAYKQTDIKARSGFEILLPEHILEARDRPVEKNTEKKISVYIKGVRFDSVDKKAEAVAKEFMDDQPEDKQEDHSTITSINARKRKEQLAQVTLDGLAA